MSIESVRTYDGTKTERQERWLNEAMEGEHGSFAQQLAHAFDVADSNNAKKLAIVFPDNFDNLIPLAPADAKITPHQYETIACELVLALLTELWDMNKPGIRKHCTMARTEDESSFVQAANFGANRGISGFLRLCCEDGRTP